MKPIIEISQVSKKFHLGHNQASYLTLRDTLSDLAKLPLRVLSPSSSNNLNEHEFWALKDISLDIQKGEVLGVIGSNGAGKSTLLKILSRITPPTSGEIILRGRVASLLEVGTGFNPELTGRENIYLNGSILGMTRSEIRNNFKQIVDFAEIEKFLDTPVKHYSSGMYMRLAFSVAAHLQPEILLVDEVLAVGDTNFQQKCLGQMNNIASQGRTVVFVSHNLSALKKICHQGVLLGNGHLLNQGPIHSVIEKYLAPTAESQQGRWKNNTHINKQYFNIQSISVTNSNGKSITNFSWDQSIYISIDLDLRKFDAREILFMQVYQEDVLVFNTFFKLSNLKSTKPELKNIICHIPAKFLNHGNYQISVHGGFHNIESFFQYDRIVHFHVTMESHQGIPLINHQGAVFPELNWQVNNL